MLNLGQRVGAPAGTDAPFLMRPENLLRHAVLLGGSGSGKTVASKVLVEEMLREGIPSIVVDPQGDLASLAIPGDAADVAQHGVPDATAREVLGRAEVVVWTPGSEAGIPLGLAPLSLADLPADADERSETLSVAARAVVSLLGLNLEKDEGKSAEAASVLCLEDAAARGAALTGFDGLAEALTKPSAALAARLDGVSTAAERDSLAKKLRRALVGSTGRLFDRGVPLDVGTLLGKDARIPAPAGSKEAYPRTRCSVIYLNSLSSAEEKEFFVAELVRALVRWMLQHPSDKPQCFFFIDEVAPFLPPVRKPACRDALRLLVKQARKYGVACAFATQNPGDIDYKSLAQCSTWALGRITQKQDLKKLSTFLKGVAPEHAGTVEALLPARPAGELLWLAPDVEKGMIPVKTRWLVTSHKTLDQDDVKKLTKPELRERFARAAAPRASAAAKADAPAKPAKAASPARAAGDDAGTVAAAEPAKGAKAKSGRSGGARARAAAPAPEAAPEPPEDAGQESQGEDDTSAPAEVQALEKRIVDRLEADKAAYTADEVLALFPQEPASRVRRALRELSEAGGLKRDKCGRSFVHWFPRWSFDLPNRRLRAVQAAEPRILEGDALARAQRHARSKLVFLDAEKVSGLALRYLPLHRVKVRATRQKGFFVKEAVTVDSTVYLHPRDARVLELAGDTFRFVAAPRAQAEDVRDLDQVVQSELPWVTPGSVPVDEALAPALGAADVEARLRQKFAVDEVLGIDVVHLPYWEFKLVDSEKKTERTGRLDALLGGWLVLEDEPEKA